MEVALLDFVRQCKDRAKQALGNHAGEPAAGGFARWKHVVFHCLRIEDEHTYRELIDRVSLMGEIREEFELDPDDLPDPSTVCKAFDRSKMRVWRQLLRVSAQQLGGSGHVALGSTFFERGHASQYYRRRSDRTIQTVKVTTLTDVDSLDVEPLILQKGSTPLTVGHNAVIREKGYDQRWMAETPYSVVKRSLGDAVRAHEWFREFREIILLFTVYNIERTCSAL